MVDPQTRIRRAVRCTTSSSSTATATSSRTFRARRSHSATTRARPRCRCARWARSSRARWWAAPRRTGAATRAAFCRTISRLRSRKSPSATARLSPEDCTSQDWGVTWDEIEPYYDQFENIYGVGGKAGNLKGEIQPGGNPHEGPRSREFPNPPTRRTPHGEIFAKAASELGYVPFQGPAAAHDARLQKSLQGDDARVPPGRFLQRATSVRRARRRIRFPR